MLFIRYEEIPDEWTPPDPQPYKEQRDLHYYLLEPDAYDQFSVICSGGNPVQIWLNTIPQPTKIEERAVCLAFVLLYSSMHELYSK